MCPEEYMWCFSVPIASSEVNRFIDLSSTDQYYLDHPHRRQCVALRFLHLIDPLLLVRGLHAAIQQFPKVGSRVVIYDGSRRFHLENEQTKLRVVMVSPDFLTDIFEWRRLFYLFSDRLDRQHKPLFQAFLMRSRDESLGCVLFAGFEHCLGDAASYAMFIACWSEEYQQQLTRHAANTALTQLPPDIYASPDEGDYGDGPQTNHDRPEPRRYELSAELLSTMKAEMRRLSGDNHLSVNDILMAQVCPPPYSPTVGARAGSCTKQVGGRSRVPSRGTVAGTHRSRGTRASP